MKNIIFKHANVILTVVIAIAIGFFAGMYVQSKNSYLSSATSSPAVSDGIDVSSAQFAPFWSAWKILSSRYVEATSTTDQQKIWGSIKGLASSFNDPYTVFFPPAQSKIFREDIAGNFSGVGMEIGKKDGQLTVVAPLKDSPAEKAGVKAGDKVLFINATSTADMGVDEAVSYIRGPQGTTVKITFLAKDSAKPVERSIMRDVIQIPTLETATKPGDIFVIKIYSFSAQSPNLFRDALRKFISSGDHKLVIDLRGNPGGYLEAAWDMSSFFLPIGKIVVTEDFGTHGSPNVFRSRGYNVFGSGLQLLILTDGGSASASEIMAGALQENGVAKLVGSKTFGKGSVQELIPITSDSSLKVTIARWLTPLGHNLSHDGLEPDYPVSVSDSIMASGKDLVMDKAVEILTARP